MPRKGMRSLLFSPKSSSPSPSTMSKFSFNSPSRFSSSSTSSPSRPSFSESVMDRTLEIAEPIIMKWNPETTTFAKVTSLFYESRREARDFIKLINQLQRAMHFIVTENSSTDKLIKAQHLMQIAMKRLQKEFYQILSMNRAHLDPESVSTRSSLASTRSSTSDFDDVEDDDQDDPAGESITEVEDVSSTAMADLRLIAECMISSGYAKECVNIYKITRKSIIDEGIYKLGVEKLTTSQIHKMDWAALDIRIKNWLEALRVSVKTLFNGERILCDQVFASSDSIRESIFTDISKEGALILFGFPENVVKHSKKSPPEKVFRALDMYTAISNYWPEIEFIFSFESTAAIRSHGVASLIKIGEYVRAAVADFETALQKDNSKSLVAGGGVHTLTTDAMNYLSLLADYSNVLSDIFADSPTPSRTSLPESYFSFSDPDESGTPVISLRFAWLILICLAKIDRKAELYKDASLSYLFLANNLQYVVVKVRSSNLKYLLGDDWISKHEAKVKQFAANYERLAWSNVINTLPENPASPLMTAEEAKDRFKRFNAAFEQAHRKQSLCVVPDSKLRDDIKVSIARKILPVYREFYNKQRGKLGRGWNLATIVRYSPDDVGNYLSDLFFSNFGPGSFSSKSSPSSSHSRESQSPSRIAI